MPVCAQVEDMFRAGSDAVIPAAQWPTAKDDLEMDLVQMLKDKASNVRYRYMDAALVRSACISFCLFFLSFPENLSLQ